MDNVKLRLKVGPHEFEAEGPPETVSAYLEAWKREIATPPASNGSHPQTTPSMPAVAPSPTALDEEPRGDAPPVWRVTDQQIRRLFTLDERRDLVRLRALPTGDTADGDGVMLALYGILRLKREDEVGATKLIAALDASGMRPGRLDRAAVRELRERWITRTGTGKGGRYRLTTTGVARAEDLALEALRQFV